MRLSRLYVRFFKSFNYDFERKAHTRAEPKEWELIDGVWFPFIRVDLDSVVTAVVGANESGKSHLLGALTRALTGEKIDRRDFCRYSQLFSVEHGEMRVPDFGVEVQLEGEEDVALVSGLGLDASDGSFVTLVRMGNGPNLLLDSAGGRVELTKTQLTSFEDRLPLPFELETRVPLPDSVSFDTLLGRARAPLSKRRKRFALVELLRDVTDGNALEAVTKRASDIAALLENSEDPAASVTTSAELARTLLVDVAQIDPNSFVDLESAIRNGEEGRAEGLIEQMNRSLRRHLNFSRWWRQDRDFQLRLSPRDHDLTFTIRDRTGTEYSFGERSRGLTYFLSYFVQLRAHRQPSGRPEVLLMDEPDAYLSSAGQQDLLRTLEHFARPDDGSRRDQVVYVTHSPFLINKNAAHRIRVLDKGTDEEGTRVVRDVARNSYEPLRSSIGAYVAETAFIGGANLLVEGVSDQVLLTALTARLLDIGISSHRLLDLNEVTIVPAGSADSVPYMAYLARGRDEIKPPCIALLDGDDAGREAIRKISRKVDGRSKPIFKEQYAIDVAKWAEANRQELALAEGVTVVELEDLIPTVVAAEAGQAYARRLLGHTPEESAALRAEDVDAALPAASGRVFDALEIAFAQAFDGGHIEKVGFAKEVAGFVETARYQPRRPKGLLNLEQNMEALLAHLAARLRQASADEAERRTNRRTDRLVRLFLRDHPTDALRDAADAMLRDLDASLDESVGDEAIRQEIAGLRRSFKLSADPLTPVPDFDEFRGRLERLGVQRRIAHRDEADSISRRPHEA